MVRSTLLTLITKVGFEACLETYVVCFPSFSSLPPFDYSALGRDPASLKRRQTSQRCCCALLHQLLRSLLRGAEHRCISPLPETASSFRKSWSVRITFFFPTTSPNTVRLFPCHTTCFIFRHQFSEQPDSTAKEAVVISDRFDFHRVSNKRQRQNRCRISVKTIVIYQMPISVIIVPAERAQNFQGGTANCRRLSNP